jgi:hypothetical protein
MERTLFRLLRVLNASNISAAASLTPEETVGLWLGDAAHGIQAYAFFRLDELDVAARWLTGKALQFFPDSPFAKASRSIAQIVGTAPTSAGTRKQSST